MRTVEHTRRRFLLVLVGSPLLTAFTTRRRPEQANGVGALELDHPEPRPGIDGSKVLPADKVPGYLAPLYDGIREIPEIADGIRCTCGCAELPGYHSLLTCYEGGGMAQACEICQGEATLVIRLHGDGSTLAQIRAAVDRRFG